MASGPVRDPVTDPLLTPQSALLVIDYQPSQIQTVGGTSPEGLERTVQAGARPIGWVSLACELQRDWARTATVPEVVDIVLTSRLPKGL